MHSIADTEVDKFGSALKAFLEKQGYEVSSA
jgi:hypothetical protein